MAVFTSELYPSRDALDDGKYTKILTRLSRSRRAISSSTRDASNRRTRLPGGGVKDEDKDEDEDEGPVIRGYEGDEDEGEDEGRASSAAGTGWGCAPFMLAPDIAKDGKEFGENVSGAGGRSRRGVLDDGIGSETPNQTPTLI